MSVSTLGMNYISLYKDLRKPMIISKNNLEKNCVQEGGEMLHTLLREQT